MRHRPVYVQPGSPYVRPADYIGLEALRAQRAETRLVRLRSLGYLALILMAFTLFLALFAFGVTQILSTPVPHGPGGQIVIPTTYGAPGPSGGVGA